MADGMPVQRCASMGCQVGMRWLGMILSCACTSTCACSYTCLHTLTRNSSMWHTQTHTAFQCGIVVSQCHLLLLPEHCLGREETIDGCKFQAQSKSVWSCRCFGCCMHVWIFMCLHLFFRRGCWQNWSDPVAAFCTHYIKTVGQTYVRQSVCLNCAALMHQPLAFGILSHRQQYRAVTSMRPPALNRPSWRWQL